MIQEHTRAQRLILEGRVEGLAQSDQRWLDEHLSACPSCANYARATDDALVSLRSVAVQIDPELIQLTRLRIYQRAEQLRDEKRRIAALSITCALSWVLGVASAPFVWRAFAWLGRTARLPALVWETGFALWWLAPAGFFAAILVWHRWHTRSEESIRAGRSR